MNPQQDHGYITRAPYWRFLRMFVGFVVWVFVFVLLYGGHALTCLYVLPGTPAAGVARGVLIVLWLGAVGCLAYLAWRGLYGQTSPVQSAHAQQNLRFLRRVTCLLDIFAGVAAFATGLPLLGMQFCGP